MELCLSQLLLEVFVFSPLHLPTINEHILGDSVCVVGGGMVVCFFSGVFLQWCVSSVVCFFSGILHSYPLI